jgi:multidrug efflux system membrane fusion protein
MRKRTFFIILGILIALAVGWRLMNPTPKESLEQSHAGRNAAVSVRSATAQKGEINVVISALGSVTPLANVTVRTQINGQIIEIGFKEGQLVQEGDFLVQIDPRPYQIALAQAEGQLMRDQALLKDAELNLSRYQKLLKQDSIARQQLDTQASLVQQYKGALQADQAQIDSAKLNLTYARIVAPIKGRVGLRQIDVGNYAQTSDTNGIVTITATQPITALFTLPEDNVPALMKRLKEAATLEVTAYDRNQSTKLATGKLSSVNNQIDTATGTIKLRAQFDNEDEALFPNQFVNIRLLLNTLRDSTVIPLSGVQRGIPGTFVYFITPENTVTVRPVTLGPDDGSKVAITQGLNPGDRIVVDGTDRLREGAKVSVPDTPSGSEQQTPARVASPAEEQPRQQEATAPEMQQDQRTPEGPRPYEHPRGNP